VKQGRPLEGIFVLIDGGADETRDALGEADGGEGAEGFARLQVRAAWPPHPCSYRRGCSCSNHPDSSPPPGLHPLCGGAASPRASYPPPY